MRFYLTLKSANKPITAVSSHMYDPDADESDSDAYVPYMNKATLRVDPTQHKHMLSETGRAGQT